MNPQTLSNPLLIGKQEDIATEQLNLWLLPKTDLQNIIDAYDALNLPALESIAEVSALIHNFDTLIFNKMTGGGLTVKSNDGATLQVNGEAAMTLLTKPKGYEELKQLVLAFTAKCKAGYQLHVGGRRLGLKSPDMVAKFVYDDGELSFCPALQAELDDTGNIYITTEKGRAIYSFLKKVAAAAKEENMGKYLALNNRKKPNTNTIAPEALHDALNELIRGYDLELGLPHLILSTTPNPRPNFDK